jgi:hypothetical protein
MNAARTFAHFCSDFCSKEYCAGMLEQCSRDEFSDVERQAAADWSYRDA